jgi:DNA gyrase subunit B
MYSSKQIDLLTGLEAIRHRPGMFIGSTDKQGLHHLVNELIDNAVDEALNGFCDQIWVHLHADGACTVRDNGRGIPFELHEEKGVSVCELLLTTLHSGGKFSNDAYQISGGLHGVGLCCVNALSEKLELVVHRNKSSYSQTFYRGVPETAILNQHDSAGTTNGTSVRFMPDARIFRTDLLFDVEIVRWKLQQLSYLIPTCQFHLLVDGQSEEVFFHPSGIVDLVKQTNKGRRPSHDTILDIQHHTDKWSVQAVLQWTNLYSQESTSFVNTIPTVQGGAHVNAFEKALFNWAKESFADKSMLNASLPLKPTDILEGLTSVLSLHMSDPEFHGQTKGRLNDSGFQTAMQNAFMKELTSFFATNKEVQGLILQRIYESYNSRVVSTESGRRSRLQTTPLIATPDVYKSQFGERSKNWHDSAVWIAHDELLAAHGSFCKVPAESTLLDVCCGSGVVGNSFRGRVSKIIGLDITPEMVELSKERLDEVVHGTVFDIPFPDASFEIVSNREVMHLMPEPAKMMSEVVRVLKPGGQFVVGQIIPFSPIDAPWMFRIFKKKQPLLYHMFLEDEFEKLLTDAGLVDIERKEMLVWEDIDVWIDTIETSSWHRREIRSLYLNAPEAVKEVHPFEVLPSGKIRDCWRWLIYSGRKPDKA